MCANLCGRRTDTATLKALLCVVESLVAEQTTPLNALLLGSTILRLLGLAKLSEPASTSAAAAGGGSNDEPVSMRAAEVCAACLWCFVLVDTRQFEDAAADLVRFLHTATHTQAPFAVTVGASLAASCATQPQAMRIDNAREQSTVVVCRFSHERRAQIHVKRHKTKNQKPKQRNRASSACCWRVSCGTPRSKRCGYRCSTRCGTRSVHFGASQTPHSPSAPFVNIPSSNIIFLAHHHCLCLVVSRRSWSL